jgi:L-aminopeptidase/D-esterase-like protein
MVVALNVDLTRSQALRVAIMAQDGLARAIRPSHCPNDGDTLFVICTGEKEHPPGDTAGLLKLGMMAADCVARSIPRGVYEAESLGRWPSYRDFHKLNKI